MQRVTTLPSSRTGVQSGLISEAEHVPSAGQSPSHCAELVQALPASVAGMAQVSPL